jgi:hypothetical protein
MSGHSIQTEPVIKLNVVGQGPPLIFTSQLKIRYMPNMSYCRFENTYNDLIDCLDNISSEAGNERDERYRIRLIKLIADNMDLINDLKDIEPEYQ